MTLGSAAATAYKAFSQDVERLGCAKLHDAELDLLQSAAETRLLGGDIEGETCAALALLANLEDAGRIEAATSARLGNGLLAIPLAVEHTQLAA
jgi:hypothetical protein